MQGEYASRGKIRYDAATGIVEEIANHPDTQPVPAPPSAVEREDEALNWLRLRLVQFADGVSTGAGFAGLLTEATNEIFARLRAPAAQGGERIAQLEVEVERLRRLAEMHGHTCEDGKRLPYPAVLCSRSAHCRDDEHDTDELDAAFGKLATESQRQAVRGTARIVRTETVAPLVLEDAAAPQAQGSEGLALEVLQMQAADDWAGLIGMAQRLGCLPEGAGYADPFKYEWKGDYAEDARYTSSYRHDLIRALYAALRIPTEGAQP